MSILLAEEAVAEEAEDADDDEEAADEAEALRGDEGIGGRPRRVKEVSRFGQRADGKWSGGRVCV